MDTGGISPCEPEEADGKEDGAEEGGGKTGFRRGAIGRAGFGGFVSDSVVAFIVRDGVDDRGKHTNCDTEEGEAADAFGPAAVLLVDNRESAKHEVEGTVDDGHVDA